MNNKLPNGGHPAKKKAERKTLPKAIVDKFKSGDKSGAMDLAVYGRETTALVELARDLYWFFKVQNRKIESLAATGGGERRGWLAPRKQTKKSKLQRLSRWKGFKKMDLEARIETGSIWYGKKFFEHLERELRLVCDVDIMAQPFQPPGSTKDQSNNPNFFRQYLIANIGMKNLLGRAPFPLSWLSRKLDISVRNLRREARKLGATAGPAGRPATEK